MNYAPRNRRAARSRAAGRRARGRRLSIERLDMRVVLSSTNLLAVDAAMFAGRQVDGPGPAHDSAGQFSSGIGSTSPLVVSLSPDGGPPRTGSGPGHHAGRGHSPRDELRFGHRSPPGAGVLIPAALVVNQRGIHGLPGGHQQGMWFVAVTTWSIPVLRGPSLGVLGLGAPAAPPTQSAQPANAANPTVPVLPELSAAPAVATAGAPSTQSPENIFETTVSAAVSVAPRATTDTGRGTPVVSNLASTQSTVLSLAPTPLRAVEGVFVLPRDIAPADGFQVPERGTSPPQVDSQRDATPSVPIFESEGGLIEPGTLDRSATGNLPAATPGDSIAPREPDQPESRVNDEPESDTRRTRAVDEADEPSNRPDDAEGGQTRNVDGESTADAEADHDARFNPRDGKDRSPMRDEATAAGRSSVDKTRLVDEADPANDAVARFDEGGMIELDARATTSAVRPPSGGRPLHDTVDVTVNAGVALFQAFELSTEAGAAASPSAEILTPEPVPAPIDAPRDDEARAADEGANRAERAVFGAGLGVALTSSWWRRVRSFGRKNARWPTIRLPRESG